MSDSQHPILYSFRRCPYAMRARMALYGAGIVFEMRDILLKNKPQAMLEASPKGTVPVLVLPSGKVIDESLDIMHWALGQKDPHGWHLKSDEISAMIAHNDDGFKKALDRYKYPSRFPDEDTSGARDICFNIFKDLNLRLEKGRFLCGPSASMADIAIFPFIRQCAAVDTAWFDGLPFSRLQQWLGMLLETRLFATIMTKYEPWQEGDAPIIIAPMNSAI
jgi:glutathione S-transferase